VDFLARMFSKPNIVMLKSNSDPVKKGEPILRLTEGRNEVIVGTGAAKQFAGLDVGGALRGAGVCDA